MEGRREQPEGIKYAREALRNKYPGKAATELAEMIVFVDVDVDVDQYRRLAVRAHDFELPQLAARAAEQLCPAGTVMRVQCHVY